MTKKEKMAIFAQVFGSVEEKVQECLNNNPNVSEDEVRDTYAPFGSNKGSFPVSIFGWYVEQNLPAKCHLDIDKFAEDFRTEVIAYADKDEKAIAAAEKRKPVKNSAIKMAFVPILVAVDEDENMVEKEISVSQSTAIFIMNEYFEGNISDEDEFSIRFTTKDDSRYLNCELHEGLEGKNLYGKNLRGEEQCTELAAAAKKLSAKA